MSGRQMLCIIRRLHKEDKGNIALIFAFSLMPLIAAIGAVIDYGRASNALAILQNASDSAALAAGNLPATLSRADQVTKTKAWVRANMTSAPKDITLVNVDVTFPDKGQVQVTSEAVIPAYFMSLFGIDNIPISVVSLSKWGTTKLEVALVLDNTGSMAGQKLNELIKASTNMVNTFSAAARSPGDIKVSIVPFNTTVKPGPFFNTSMLRFNPNSGPNETKIANSLSGWTGCVIDRDQPYDVSDASPSSSSSKFPAAQSKYCNSTLQAIQPLDYDWIELKRQINNMQAVGNTNVTIGLMWGLATLTPTAPFTEASSITDSKELRKVIILLTDGDNTEYRFCNNSTPYNGSCSQSGIDARTAAACATVKSSFPNMTVYTIRVIDGNRSLLKSCATDSSKYYEISNASALTSVFDKIAGELVRLHLAK
jgi:Flp pilus assembly protein TadG